MEVVVRGQKIAETLIKKNDFVGAREKLMEIQKKIPSCANISQMLLVCDILCASGISFLSIGCKTEKVDWYWVLQTTDTADMSQIKSKYLKLTKELEPIKNIFPGTKVATALVQNAYEVLSDKEKRLIFDLKRADLRSSYGCENTACETSDKGKGVTKVQDHTKGLRRLAGDSNYYDFNNNRKAELFANGQVWVAYDKEKMPRKYARVVNIERSPSALKLKVTWLRPSPVTDHEKKWCEMGLPVACGYFSMDKTNILEYNRNMFSHLFSHAHSFEGEKFEVFPKKGQVWAIYRNWQPFKWCSHPRERNGCRLEMVEILTVEDSGMKVVWLTKVDGSKSIFQRCIEKDRSVFYIPRSDLFRFSHNVPAFRLKGGEMERVVNGMLELDPFALAEILAMDMEKPAEGENSKDGSAFAHPPSLPIISETKIILSEPKWSRDDFTSGQIWAVYSESLPRYYIVVSNIISEFQVSATLLDRVSMLDDEKYWAKQSLPIVCGLFKLGKITTNLGMSRFSHIVAACKSDTSAPLYKVYPKRGEIWAVYKNWNAKWKQPDFRGSEFQVVEILSDFSEGDGVKVVRLVQVEDFKTIFKRKQDSGLESVYEISRRRILSLSHQIPCFTIRGSERYGIPKGSLHLEPHALPTKIAN
ncbi:hypothetical protein GIB67_004043 [Kingdonia uniflora]|uniref:J domain-containing protein n=1 Tax=Kingdonia uniflora TaxID=39325 RepID=A0A7J7NR17_9MAGN|nr:hypothetical protein GIB67_004043 [Kingdonia uniflora]